MAQTTGHIAPEPAGEPGEKSNPADPSGNCGDSGDNSGGSSGVGDHLWLPPGRMRRYHLNKILAAALFCALFAGWMFFQWANPIQRLLPMALAVITVLVTGLTVMSEITRARGRQITLKGGPARSANSAKLDTGGAEADQGTPILEVMTPTDNRRFELASVKRMVWQDGPDLIIEEDEPNSQSRGLWFFDSAQQVLAHIDESLLADEEEARDFIGWLRRRTTLPCKVEWPQVH
jgi:hypothetical protein